MAVTPEQIKSAKGFGGQSKPGPQEKTTTQANSYQGTQDTQAQAVAVSAGAIASRGAQQLQALQEQQISYAEAFSEAASDLIVSTEAYAWQLTAEKTAQKLGAYNPVDTVNVFSAFSLDLFNINQRLNGIREQAALPQGKATAGF